MFFENVIFQWWIYLIINHASAEKLTAWRIIPSGTVKGVDLVIVIPTYISYLVTVYIFHMFKQATIKHFKIAKYGCHSFFSQITRFGMNIWICPDEGDKYFNTNFIKIATILFIYNENENYIIVIYSHLLIFINKDRKKNWVEKKIDIYFPRK